MLHFERWQSILILLVSLLGVAYVMPNLVPAMKDSPSPLPNKSLHLGLDLQGGSHLLYDMNASEIKDDWLEQIRDDAKVKVRDARPRIAYSSVAINKTEGIVQVHIRKPEHYDRAYKELKSLIQPVQGSVFTGAGANDLIVEKSDSKVMIRLKPSPEAITQRIDSAIGTSIKTIRKRIDQLGTTEPNVQRQGRTRILVQVPGYDDPQKLKDIIGKTAKLSFHEVRLDKTAAEARQSGRPPGTIIIRGRDEGDGLPREELLLVKRPAIAGGDLIDAQSSFDENNRPVVTFRFNSRGARLFGRFTKKHLKERFAIVLDNGIDDNTGQRDIEVISAPVIQSVIYGSGQISGNFTTEETQELSILLRSGALPATLSIVEERSVGASLGEDSVAAGKLASIIGLVGVILFTLLVYGLFGSYAVVALLVNLCMLVAVLSVMQATLTLPGIAGIVLTVGMAVDANVLIYERIKEEVRAGKTAINAIDTGYRRAFGTILDANITTFIAAFILFVMGSGPVRGFAVTLSIGILTSVFTAFVLTRLIITFWLHRKKTKGLVLPM